ncbi:GNAT family N-acetyltransferase [Alloiococcus sp. CFN-8]|uniref:GNAT family N-acetyltransferase n=1 Tax=Alloiococcus sp. CFN-8 TaxID=3416081 RepID=UPI003CF7A3EF
MKIINAKMDYFEEAVDIAFNSYMAEGKQVEAIDNCSRAEISKEMFAAFKNNKGFLCLENEKLVGYLVYGKIRKSDGTLWCMVPLCGCGAEGQSRVKVISMLFQKLAEELCINQKVHFEIKLYAHDSEVIQLFSFLQFGIQCEEGIRYINSDVSCSTNVKIKELSKDEVVKNWEEIWKLLKGLIKHLQESPVFYSGTEFTEAVYKDFLMDNNTRVVVSEIEKELVGIITANKDGNSFINRQADCYNVGEAYVLPKYRGSMVAQSMLDYVSNILAKEDAHRLWVEHGTANPNARGFWNKYFTTYGYTMIRDIEVF